MEETKDEEANTINDSFAEGKEADFRAIPTLQRGQQQNATQLNRAQVPFSTRLFNGSIQIDHRDVHAVANQMLFEINMVAGELCILQHKIIEIVKAAPRFVSEYLQIQYEHQTREQWTQSIFREVIPTSNFALLPRDADQDIGETHKNLARIKRKSIEESMQQMRANGEKSNKSALDIGVVSQLKIQAEGMQESLAEVSPIIFEECYCINSDKTFVEKVKNTNEISESKINEIADDQ